VSTGFFIVGRVRRAHGIRGELVVESLTDAPDAIFASGRRLFAGARDGAPAPDAREYHVRHATPFKGGWIVALEGLTDRTTAEAWRDRTFLVPDDEVEPPAEGEVYLHDLIGMRVALMDGETVGTVREVFELPQGLVMEVERAAGDTVMLPFDEQTVRDVDDAARVIQVDPLEGMLD
jgi:16S rRNA processing protein RimM